MTTVFRRRNLVGDSVLQLPDAEGRKEQALCAAQRSDGRQRFSGVLATGIFTRAAAAGFGFTGTACFFAEGEVTGVVHTALKSSFQASD
jgi:hypothetical protein